MVNVVESNRRRFRFDKELCCTTYPKVIIGPAARFRRELDDYIPFMWWLLRLVFYVPAEPYIFIPSELWRFWKVSVKKKFKSSYALRDHNSPIPLLS
jgi:hypothetical protein